MIPVKSFEKYVELRKKGPQQLGLSEELLAKLAAKRQKKGEMSYTSK